MSDILKSVTISYNHDVLGVGLAQERLQSFDKEGAYLFRESDVRPGVFILSSIKNSSILHLAVPKKNGKILRQTLEEAFEVVEDNWPKFCIEQAEHRIDLTALSVTNILLSSTPSVKPVKCVIVDSKCLKKVFSKSVKDCHKNNLWGSIPDELPSSVTSLHSH